MRYALVSFCSIDFVRLIVFSDLPSALLSLLLFLSLTSLYLPGCLSKACALLQSVRPLDESDDIKAFRELLAQRIVAFCPESIQYLYDRAKCCAYLQHQLALHHRLPSLFIRSESDWNDLKCNATYVTKLTFDRDAIMTESLYDSLLDCHHLHSIDLIIRSKTAYSNTHLLQTLALLPSLTSLSLNCDSSEAFNIVIAPFLPSSSSSSFFIPRFQHLQWLDIRFEGEGSCESVVPFVRSACPCLSSLSLICSDFTDQQIDAFASLPIRYLDLSGCRTTTTQCAILSHHSTCSSLSLLQYLRLPQSHRDRVPAAFTRFPSLEDVQIADVPFLAATAQSFLDCLPHLQRLALYGCPEVTDECITALSKIHGLKYFHVVGEKESLLSSAIGEALASMPNLFTLHLSCHSRFNSTGLVTNL